MHEKTNFIKTDVIFHSATYWKHCYSIFFLAHENDSDSYAANTLVRVKLKMG